MIRALIFSVLSEFRARLVKAGASERLLDLLLAWCQRQGWLRARGRQRTDATHVLAAVRQLNRLELVAETLRAALNAIATVAPGWLQARVPEPWYQRYGRRIEYTRRPSSEAERQAKGQSIGEDGLQLLSWLEAPDTPAPVTELLEVQTLRTIWQRHYRREPANGKEENPDKEEDALLSGVQLATPAELAQASQAIESPYDVAARYRTKSGLGWMGYTVHLSETCEANVVHLITHVKTTPANVAEAKCTEAIQHALLAQGRARVFIWPMPVTSRPISSLAARLNGVLPCWGRYVRAPVGRTRSRAPMAGRNSPLTDWLRPLTAHKVTARSAGMRFSTPTAIAISRLILPPRTVRLVPSAAAVPAPKCSHVAFNSSPKLSNKPFNTYGLT